MSTADRALPDDGIAHETAATLQRPLATALHLCALPVRAVAFWAAVLLPLTYLPLLLTGAVVDHPLGFVGLVGLNCAAFVAGHAHNQPEA